jgi:hypothetical protein
MWSGAKLLSGRGVDTDRKAAVALLYLAVSLYSRFLPRFAPSTSSNNALLPFAPDELHHPSQTTPDHIYIR